MKSLLSKNKLLLVCLGLAFVFVTSCRKDSDGPSNNDSSKLTADYNASVPKAWYDLMLEIDRYSPGYRPPAAARMMAYVGLAAYESVVPGMPEYQSLVLQYPAMAIPRIASGEKYHWPSSANAAYATMFRYFYPHIKPADLARIDQLEARFVNEFSLEESDDVLRRSRNFGKAVAEAVFQYSATDVAGHEAFKNPHPSNYVPPKTGVNGEKLWQPTYPDFTPGLFPYWGNVRPFALKSAEMRAKPPIPYSEDPSSNFYQQASETRFRIKNATFEDRWVAEFWSDDFAEVTFEPAARQIAIANQIVELEDISLERAVELYAKIGMAMADAAIAVWGSKYIFNVRRPIEYIRDVMDPAWTTILNQPYSSEKSLTPPFPAYPSGHASFGGSGAGILTHIFGDNYSFTDNCHVNRFEFIGAPRRFSSFYEAGIENAYSRVPLGVHYRMDSDEGLRLGYLAAKRVIELPWKK